MCGYVDVFWTGDFMDWSCIFLSNIELCTPEINMQLILSFIEEPCWKILPGLFFVYSVSILRQTRINT